MRSAILIPLALTALLILPQARADDEAESAPPKPDVATTVWEAHAKTFDLDGDGRITWEEYQKVTSGFALLDADGDGAITQDDLGKLGDRLGGGLGGGHAAVFFGTPHGGLHRMFGDAGGDPTELLRQLLPLLLGGHGMHGMGPLQGMPYGPWGMPGHAPWADGCGPRGCRMQAVQMLPWLLSTVRSETSRPDKRSIESIVEKALDGGDADGVVTETILTLVPPSMKQLAAFGLVAQRADADGDRTITREEWDAGVKAVTKDDGTLDLSALKEGMHVHGMPLPGGGARIFEALLDLNDDGKVDAKDLDGVFEKADANDDGRVTHDELVPAGMGLDLGR